MPNDRIAVFPGSFDPVTLGHYDIIKRSIGLFDKVVVSVGTNSEKRPLFSIEQRLLFLQQAFAEFNTVVVDTYQGLTINYCKKIGANYIIRGLRNSSDFTFEQNIAQMNQSLAPEIESVFFLCQPALSAINSSIIRDIYKNGGKIESFLPPGVKI